MIEVTGPKTFMEQHDQVMIGHFERIERLLKDDHKVRTSVRRVEITLYNPAHFIVDEEIQRLVIQRYVAAGWKSVTIKLPEDAIGTDHDRKQEIVFHYPDPNKAL